jgi:predicted RNA polymerase sigma factor
MTGRRPEVDRALAAVIREEHGALVASLHRTYGDFDVAEESVQQAVVEALAAWRVDGVPERPGAWLNVAARRNALDLVRTSSRRRALLTAEARRAPTLRTAADDSDPRLAVLFGCCHPALAHEARLALTLRAVVGLTTAQIARAFLVSEATVAQRIVRAKRKIVTAGISLDIPDPGEIPERLHDVLTVTYLMYNEAYVSTSGPGAEDRDLGDDAVWLATLVATRLPRQAEALGLAALLTLQHARVGARFDEAGNLVLLRDQDRSQWDRAAIARAGHLLERAAALHAPGSYQLQAAIAACHTDAASWEETDWLQILTLYDLLLRIDPSPVTRLNRSIALAQHRGPAEALHELEQLAPDLQEYHLWHATRAELLRALGRQQEAEAADGAALALTSNTAEQRLLRTRLRRRSLSDGS